MKSFPYSVLLLIVFCYGLKHSHSVMDTISHGQNVTYFKPIISAGSNFKLGFFQPGSSKLYYVGIWYSTISLQTIVWVANRDYPITSLSAVLFIDHDGSLIILDNKVSHIVNNKSLKRSSNSTATLLDNGNLVLRDENLNILWQSFDYPTHMMLPGMKIGYDKVKGITWKFVSWRSLEDPSPGNYTFELSSNKTVECIIMNGSELIWTSGSWNGKFFALTPEMHSNNNTNFMLYNNDNMTYFTYNVPENFRFLSRYEIDVSGQINLFLWSEPTQTWLSYWEQPPRDHCKLSYCGDFGTCISYSFNECNCLPGFEPQYPDQWSNRNFLGGCKRKTKLACTNNNSQGVSDKFKLLPKVSVLPLSPLSIKVEKSDECKSICSRNCSCTGYTYLDGFCTIWVDKLVNIQLQRVNSYESEFYLRLASSEFQPDHGNVYKKLRIALPLTLSLTVFIIALFISLRWRKMKKNKGEDLLIFDLRAKVEASKDELGGAKMSPKPRNDVEIPFFSFSSILKGTNNFSADNKLGEGGFGPVYKGKLLNGSEVAVKRLSKKSGQGWDELKNEAMLITKLQHKNLVKLLGYCIEGDEKILVYEYMQNKSLDFFIFDPTKCGLLNWGTRINIIEGIAQGILYLHQFSRLQIIHRDLKASNILLDEDMTPKISDFGMARIFAETGPQATTRIVGTYGYMAPEYALQGLFSVKSDVFSFGVLLLEILSGKRNTGFYTTSSLNLLGRAWDLWIINKSLDLLDPILEDISSANTASRLITIALLCVQETAADRPTMSDVVSMLSNELSELPSPNLPAYSNLRSMVHPDSETNMGDVCSINEVTISATTPR